MPATCHEIPLFANLALTLSESKLKLIILLWHRWTHLHSNYNRNKCLIKCAWPLASTVYSSNGNFAPRLLLVICCWTIYTRFYQHYDIHTDKLEGMIMTDCLNVGYIWFLRMMSQSDALSWSIIVHPVGMAALRIVRVDILYWLVTLLLRCFQAFPLYLMTYDVYASSEFMTFIMFHWGSAGIAWRSSTPLEVSRYEAWFIRILFSNEYPLTLQSCYISPRFSGPMLLTLSR